VAVLFIGLYLLERKNSREGRNRLSPLPTASIPEREDNRFEFSLKGKLAPKELIFVASEEDKALTELFETQPDVLRGWGQMIGFQVIYLPLLMKRLKDKRVLQYRAPYLSDVELSDICTGNDFLLQFLDDPADKTLIKHGFIRTEDIHRGSDGEDKAVNRFYPLSSNGSESINDQLHRIGKQISEEKSRYDRLLTGHDDWGDPITGDADSNFNSQQGHENTDDLIEEVKERIAKLRQRGISEYILEQLIHPDDRLSRLVITSDDRIVLPDYHDMEIKMEPLVKAVYLLFLNHPEGILFKHLPDYRDELTQIYMKLKPKELSERALQSIADVTNPLLNSINEKCARIRGTFVGQFDNCMARNYYIDGVRGEAKKIALPRQLVVWE
jgi:hypothetical protein